MIADDRCRHNFISSFLFAWSKIDIDSCLAHLLVAIPTFPYFISLFVYLALRDKVKADLSKVDREFWGETRALNRLPFFHQEPFHKELFGFWSTSDTHKSIADFARAFDASELGPQWRPVLEQLLVL